MRVKCKVKGKCATSFFEKCLALASHITDPGESSQQAHDVEMTYYTLGHFLYLRSNSACL